MTSMVRSDALHCERVVRRHARAFTLATYFLPNRKRRASFAFYCFGRSIADITQSCGGDRKAGTRQLLVHRRALAEALEGRPRGPILREVRWAMREFSIPGDLLFEVHDKVSRDVSGDNYETWEDLERSCRGVATAIGVMCTQIFGIPGGAKQQQIALSHARTLGVAMQLTRILRDIGADARTGRCHLPEEELARFSLSRDEIVNDPAVARDPRWQRLMTFEIARARSLYEQALPGIAMLSEDSQRCAAACAIGYAAILDALEDIRYDSVSSRASLGMLTKIGVLWDAFRYRSRKTA